MNEENNIAPINEDLNVVKYELEDIKSLIYTIRGKQIMLDSDIAKRYNVETKRINEAVKRNPKRFPEEFCFKLTENEYTLLRSQIATLENYGKGKHRKYLPYVFTEQGVAMLSAVLHSEKAIEVSIYIMNAFIEMRKILSLNGQVYERLTNMENRLIEQDKKIKDLFEKFDKNETINQRIFFKGQIWDSYELIIDIIKTAKNKILIIDNYIDDTILKMLQKKEKNVEVVILTSKNCQITKLDIKKFNERYPTLKIAFTNKFHDRFIIIDNKDLYHCGASLKDSGKKCFAISKIEDYDILKSLKDNILFSDF